jgi:hypothetical protein
VAWFAVGCYYLLTENNETAQPYFKKAWIKDRTFGPAWLGCVIAVSTLAAMPSRQHIGSNAIALAAHWQS